MGTTAGIGLGLLVIAGVLIFKGKTPRLAGWLIMLGTLGAAPIVLASTGLASILTGFHILGDSIAILLFIATAILFWHEVVKGHGMHYVRTPVVAGLVAVSALCCPGVIGQIAHNTQTGVTTTVAKVTNGG